MSSHQDDSRATRVNSRRLASICKEVHECLYRNRDRDAAKRFLPELEGLLRPMPKDYIAIVGAEGLALYHTLRGELQPAIEHRRREIGLMHRLHKDVEMNDYDEKTRAYVLTDRDMDALQERNEILESLERELEAQSSDRKKDTKKEHH